MSVPTYESDLLNEYAPEQDIPVHSYAVLMSVFLGLAGAFAGWFKASGREMPDRIDATDLALLTVASHKAEDML